MNRRGFVKNTRLIVAGSTRAGINPAIKDKRRVAIVGTGSRGIGMWGKPVIEEFGHLVQFVGLCDINPGRARTAKK